MRRYILYLAPELQKFKDRNWALKFFAKFQNHELFEEFNLPMDIEIFAKQFSEKETIIKYLENQTQQTIIKLSRFLSIQWRENGAAHKLDKFQDWRDEEIEIGSIFVYPAEECLNTFFAENDFSLLRIVADQRIMSSKPYYTYTPGSKVDFKTLLAIKKGNTNYHIFDGVHRAIQLAVNGEEVLYLCSASYLRA